MQPNGVRFELICEKLAGSFCYLEGVMKTFVALLLMLVPAPAAWAQRLPDVVVPEHYTLWFAPDLQNATFRGRATIQVQVKAASREIMLHAAEMTFTEATVASGGNTQTARITLDERRETATLLLPQPVAAGPATLHFTYTGILNNKLRGFYLSKANGRNYAVSQMEATDARRAFPSFDEPVYKATFDVTLMVDQGDTAISNGRQLSDTPGPDPGKHTVTFARTPKMSTYLVALLVGDFVCREGSADGTPVRICSTPDKLALTGFAMDATIHQLQFYNRYFGIKYPHDKLDIIAIPDFAAGAMENFGAITFRERLLLADPDRASLAVLKNIAGVISHEIAHQWFGNLVTMKWWDDIWLNEGFATWMANKPLADWKPDWHVELDDVEDTLTAKGTDALRTTRPVRMDVETPDEINEVFDAIAYEKGSAVLRMIESFVGPEPFRQAVASYLRRFSYQNAAAEDFWTEVTRVTGKPVDQIMRTFIDQAGIPVLAPRAACAAGQTRVTVQQERFTGTPAGAASQAQTWNVPVCLAGAAGGAPRCEMITQRTQTISVPGCATSPSINAGSLGYYFSEYTPENVRALAANPALGATDRLGLLGDEWWMIRSGRHDIGVFLDVAALMGSDPTSHVVEQIRQRLSYVGEYLVPVAQRPRFEQWVRDRFTPALNAADPFAPGTRSEDQQARGAALVSLVGITGNSPELQRRARELAVGYIANPRSIAGTLAPVVLSAGAMGGDAALYDRYVEQLKRPGIEPEEYYRFFNALSWFRDPALITRTLEFAVSNDVRSQDTGTLLSQLLARPWSREAAWQFVQEKWDILVAKLGTFQGIPQVAGALQTFCSTERAGDVRQFFAKHPMSSERTLNQSIERIETCAAVQARQSPALTRWLATAR